MVNAASLYEQVMELPVAQRHEFALQILKSVGEGPGRPLSLAEFQAMLLERGEAYDRGDTETVDAFEAIEHARTRIQGIRSGQE
jgi:hypothetical protein